MPIKTLIDGTLLAECELKGNIRSGMMRVAEEITKGLLSDSDLELTFINSKEIYKNYQPLKNFLKNTPSKNAKKVLSPLFAGMPFNLDNKISERLHQKFFKGRVLVNKLSEYDLFHSFFYPFPSNVEANSITKCITFLDIIPLKIDGYPQYLNILTKQIIENIVPNFAISISEFSKQDLCDYDNRVDPERVFVVPLAADKKLFYNNKNKTEWLRVKEEYKLPDKYFLSIASTDIRKNQEQVIKSFCKLLLQQKINDLFLVSTGNSTFDSSLLDRLNVDSKIRSKIIFVKPIRDEDLSVVYSNAYCFFFMSFYEGFGLPALEAMQCGTPVISSNTTSLPEVVGNAGLMISPTDGDALCEAMNNVYKDDALRQSLSDKGIRQAATFSWQRCVDEYSKIFKQIGTK